MMKKMNDAVENQKSIDNDINNTIFTKDYQLFVKNDRVHCKCNGVSSRYLTSLILLLCYPIAILYPIITSWWTSFKTVKKFFKQGRNQYFMLKPSEIKELESILPRIYVFVVFAQQLCIYIMA